MQVHLADLWFVVDGDDITAMPDDAYTTKAEAEQAAQRLTTDTADFRARVAPNSRLPSARQFEDVWWLVRDNVRDDVQREITERLS